MNMDKLPMAVVGATLAGTLVAGCTGTEGGEAYQKNRAHVSAYVAKALASGRKETNVKPATFKWVTVVNPMPLHNGNVEFQFGDICSTDPEHGGKIGIIADLPGGQKLEEYTTVFQTYGAPCASGTLFLSHGSLQVNPDQNH